ncbi:hypothetical protein VOLCADRAFT_95613 [Volvox carteri f. nagariensis]|uniref:Aminotransferase class V domain-containing protein n=1 Tax=Volvox carteri f. nagariensis TaxID=3068 RepID=D8U829_VOLCA|nr:uncharacterized protein VOLCADRAFT_95613 [Volvox carteri f. nagariensis]EFJ44195.1 hypothetical protein VOLCADRAFT_95613 [Volvox carteri f. nagariensis]|eukprot:XP_002954789.1 hypothetical protein VOLCADRAFT_95613 [Volvox carteri f. nagariensis]
MGGLGDIARHFGLKAIYVLAVWGVTRVFRAGRRRLLRQLSNAAERDERRPPPTAAQTPQHKPAPRYKVYHNLTLDYKPSNPRWLQEAVSLDPADLATDLSWQCPILIRFQTLSAASISYMIHAPSKFLRMLTPPWCPCLTIITIIITIIIIIITTSIIIVTSIIVVVVVVLALEVQSWYRQQLEAQPVRFMEIVAMKGLVWAVADAARFVGACPADVVPLVNATSAVNAVLGSLELRRGDWVLMLNTTYPAVQLGLEELLRPELVVDAVQAALGAVGGRRRVRLAVLDHVVSFPPVVLPVAELVKLCKKVGARVLVDGAHAIGNVPSLQVPTLGADYYTTNLHKWGCSPKAAALLWVVPEHQDAMRPLVTSHGYRLGFRVAGMLAVQLPPLREYGCTAEDSARLQRWLRYEKNIEHPRCNQRNRRNEKKSGVVLGMVSYSRGVVRAGQHASAPSAQP